LTRLGSLVFPPPPYICSAALCPNELDLRKLKIETEKQYRVEAFVLLFPFISFGFFHNSKTIGKKCLFNHILFHFLLKNTNQTKPE
jgi:hypothetical protein